MQGRGDPVVEAEKIIQSGDFVEVKRAVSPIELTGDFAFQEAEQAPLVYPGEPGLELFGALGKDVGHGYGGRSLDLSLAIRLSKVFQQRVTTQ